MKFFFILLFSSVIFATERPSLKKYLEEFEQSEEITAAYKQQELPSKLFQWLKKNEKVLTNFKKQTDQSAAFVRGEIEDEKVLNFVTELLQLSILKIRWLFKENKMDEMASEIKMWFNFSADLSYEETTLVGLRLAHVIRSLLLDEMDQQIKSNLEQFAEAKPWLLSLRAPWPVDRVVLFEAKRTLKPTAFNLAEKVAKEIQKTPYQTTESCLSKLKGGQAADLEFLKKLWREEDLAMMKTEMNRLGLLKAASDWAHFKKRNNKEPSSWQELGSESTTDYFTGKPMLWAQLVATVQKSH